MLSGEYTPRGLSAKNAYFQGPTRGRSVAQLTTDVQVLLRKERIMKRFQSRLGIAVAGLALMAAPTLAGQRPTQDSGSPASDRAVDRGSAAGGGSVAGSAGGSVASGGSSGGSSSTAPSSVASSPSFGAGERNQPMYAEPQRRGGGGGSASGGSSPRGGGNGGDHAAPRGGSSSRGTSKSGGDAATKTGGEKSGGDATTSSSSSGRSNAAPARDNGEAVPSWSRPRGDRPVSGTATERVGPPPDRRGGFGGRSYNPFYYDPYYYGFSPYGSLRYPGFGIGYGYGLGLGWPIFYDPWYDPWYATSGYAGYGYGSMGYNTSTYAGVDQGKIRLKVKPRNAKVYVDGYFVGNVDQFDGAFQKLALNGGRHRVEIKADGYETADFDVLITPDETVTYQGELKKIQ